MDTTQVIDPREELNFMDEDNYVTDDVAFNYLSLEVIKDNVSEQIKSLANLDLVSAIADSLVPIRINYLDKFKSKFNSVFEIIDSDNVDLIESLNNCKEQFYDYVLKLIFERFKLNFTFNFTYTSKEERYLYIEALYKFFVIDIEDTMVNYVVNNMINNSKFIIKSMKPLVNKKDISFNLFKKQLNNTDYAVLIYNVENYMDGIEKESIEDFIEDSLTMKDEPLEGYRDMIKDIFIDEYETIIEDLSFDFSEIKNIIKYILDNSVSTILKIKTSLVDYYKKLS